MSEWISVKDRFPEEPGDYLVCSCNFHNGKTRPHIYYYDKTKGFDGTVITHWMPIPEPPISGWCKECMHWHRWSDDDPRSKLHVMACGDCDVSGEWSYYDNYCDDWVERNEEEETV